MAKINNHQFNLKTDTSYSRVYRNWLNRWIYRRECFSKINQNKPDFSKNGSLISSLVGNIVYYPLASSLDVLGLVVDVAAIGIDASKVSYNKIHNAYKNKALNHQPKEKHDKFSFKNKLKNFKSRINVNESLRQPKKSFQEKFNEDLSSLNDYKQVLSDLNIDVNDFSDKTRKKNITSISKLVVCDSLYNYWQGSNEKLSNPYDHDVMNLLVNVSNNYILTPKDKRSEFLIDAYNSFPDGNFTNNSLKQYLKIACDHDLFSINDVLLQKYIDDSKKIERSFVSSHGNYKEPMKDVKIEMNKSVIKENQKTTEAVNEMAATKPIQGQKLTREEAMKERLDKIRSGNLKNNLDIVPNRNSLSATGKTVSKNHSNKKTNQQVSDRGLDLDCI